MGRDKLQLLNPVDLQKMRASGLVLAETLATVRENLAAGMTTAEVDKIAEEAIRSRGAIPAFLGYHGFTGTLCISINEEIVHGIPGKRVIKPGDVVSIDGGAVLDGWYSDSAFTVLLPGPDAEKDAKAADLIQATEKAMWASIAAFQPGAVLNDIGGACEDAVDEERFGIVEEYTGHGIGRELHLEPEVLGYRVRRKGPTLKPGLCLAIEPMLVEGDPATRLQPDGWTVVSAKGGRAAHSEHTVALTSQGPWVLTALDGGLAALTEAGVPAGAAVSS